MNFSISNKAISIKEVAQLMQDKRPLALSEEARQTIIKGRTYLEEKTQNEDRLYYGINTGFGSLCNVEISKDQIEILQQNLVKSHACGTGNPVKESIVRLMLFLKIISLAKGYSGVSLALIERLIFFYNNDILPIVYENGSLGASGDLAPLAHLSLPLLGLGEVVYKGEKMAAKDLHIQQDITPLTLKSKEGLALLNGTQFMCAYGISILIESKRLFDQLILISTMSIDAFQCRADAFHPLIHSIRHHQGQNDIARKIYQLLQKSELATIEKKQIQDPYSFRCIPQVHGASMDTWTQAADTFTKEMNSVTDNPSIFPDDDIILSGGNFHGQPLAYALDFLAIALSELGNISERRIYLLLSGNRNLPPFLIENAGLNSGLMIPQYSAAALVNKNKILCTPASIDTIISSNGQEDHVSMGANAATKCFDVLHNVQTIIAIELFAAAQAIAFRRPYKSAPEVEKMFEAYRKEVPFLEQDRALYVDIQKTEAFLKKND